MKTLDFIYNGQLFRALFSWKKIDADVVTEFGQSWPVGRPEIRWDVIEIESQGPYRVPDEALALAYQLIEEMVEKEHSLV